MPRDKALSHEKIMRAAMDEFFEYGYDKASMRRIGERCGLTAAALYRHFDSKESMFREMVEPALRDMRAWLESHADGGELQHNPEIDMMRELVYPRMEEYSMLVNKAKGSSYENFLHELVCEQQNRISPYVEEQNRLRGGRDVTDDEVHMLLTAYFTALFEPVVHRYPLDEALLYLDTVEEFFLPGWEKITGGRS